MHRGFALIEFFIIIGIVGILVSIGIPAFRNYQPSLQLSGTVRELVTDLRHAGQLAVAEQIRHGIRFSTTTNQYHIIRYGTIEEILKTKSLPQRVSFQQITGLTHNEVIFNSFGAAREAGTVTLINTKNETRIIDIRPSGFVRISN